jgi:retron-type reverse transcriptase
MAKSFGNLWDRLLSFENLLRSAEAACRGKRGRPDVARFHFRLEPNLLQLQRELGDGSYQPGAYRQFWIVEKKPRLISAAPYRDRVVHHALCRVLEPLWEPRFIYDSYACRVGKGTHAAADRVQHFLRSARWVLKLDLRKYFPSVDHRILLDRLGRHVRDEKVLHLAARIVETSPPQEPADWHFPGDDLFTPVQRPRGLPIGNQTSQFFANVHLDPLDHFIKEELGCRRYVRYVDDLVLMAWDRFTVERWRDEVVDYLATLRLRPHPRKTQVFPVRQGVNFVGYRIFATHKRVAKDNVHRARRRLRRLAEQYAEGAVSLDQVRASVHGWLGHAAHADSWRLRQTVLSGTTFARSDQSAI